MPDEKSQQSTLTLADLHLLMENYQNILQMSTLVLEQQRHILEVEKDILKKQENLSGNQISASSDINKALDGLKYCSELIEKTNNSISASCSTINNSLASKIEKTDKSISDLQLKSVEQSNKITNKIYIGMAGSAGVIISLIGLITLVYSKYEIISEIHKMVTSLLNYFNL